MIKTRTAMMLLTLHVFIAKAQADVAVSFGSGGNQFTIDFVTIGNPGNPADTTGEPTSAGAVPYVYNIGKYEVSRDAVEKANAEGNLRIFLSDMSFVTGGARPDMPATQVSWNAAARFVNYLNTSQGYSPAYKFNVQPGDPGYDANANLVLWEASDPGYNANNPFRNSQSHYFLPSVDEWYKAAFYDPNANGGTGGYWDYATGSNTAPSPVASGTDLGSAVWAQRPSQGPANIKVAGGISPYGTMAQSGNVFEWDEGEWEMPNDNAFNASSQRGLRGGYWGIDGNFPLDLSSVVRGGVDPGSGNGFVGFRVASIPEPSSMGIGILGALGLLKKRRR